MTGITKFSGRSIMMFLLVVLMLALSATPTLAWWDEGDIDGIAARPCRVIPNSNGDHSVTCFAPVPHHNRPLVRQDSPMHPAVARAEELFQTDMWATGVFVQAER